MVDVPNVILISCPDCKCHISNDYHYCRFCGHDFQNVESSGKLSSLIKKSLGSTVSNNIRYCTNCKAEIRDFNMDFCSHCGERIPFQGVKQFCSCGNVVSNRYCNVCSNEGDKKELNSEQFYQIWHNQVIIPLSKEYDKDFTSSNFREYFNLTNNQENHIIYWSVHCILFDKIEESIVEFIQKLIEETKANYENAEEVIIELTKQHFIDLFNNEGIISSDTSTIKAARYETVETQHIKNKHGAGTKVLATAVAGPLGFAATTGVKQETKNKYVHHKGKFCHEKVTLNKNHIVYETYEDDNSSGFKYSSRNSITKMVIEWTDVKSIDEDNYIILNSGDTIKCPSWSMTDIQRQSTLNVLGSVNEHHNNELFEKYNVRNKIKEAIRDTINQHIKTKRTSQNDASRFDIDALEKIVNLYKEGFLTDEEFVALKKKMIEGD